MHSGKRVFPECLIVYGTRGREALGEDPHSGKRGTREQKTMWENKDIFKTLFPECLTIALGEANLFPECLTLALGEASLFPECLILALGEGCLPRVLG
jgi:hypothetical protein